jgi:PIN domain nuclease of toxin-antitoxin system
MTSLLLDTHVLLWALDGNERLGPATRELLLATEAIAYVSSASTWELEIKRSLGKIDLPSDLISQIEDSGFAELPVRHRHIEALGMVSLPHRDPFDRLLMAQARVEGLTFVTADRVILTAGLLGVVDASR